MQRTVHRILTALTAMLVAFGLAAVISPTAANAAPGMLAGSCYAGAFTASTRLINYGNGSGVESYYTDTFRTPAYYSCHDINVSGVTANGHTVATMLRVHDGYLNGYAHPWHWVAGGWVVLETNACRGCLYTVEEWPVGAPQFGAVDMRIAA